MRKGLIDIICCPDDKELLELRDAREDEHEDVIEGKLHCHECGFDFPIEDGIPNLLPKEFHLAGAKKGGGTKSGARSGGAKDSRGKSSGGKSSGAKSSGAKSGGGQSRGATRREATEDGAEQSGA